MSLKRGAPPPDAAAADHARPSKTTKLHDNNAAATTEQPQQQQQHEPPTIYRSAPLTDRRSTFLAFFAPGTALSARALQAHPDFRSATHRIAAWRRPSAQRKLSLLPASKTSPPSSNNVVESGHDDDGESHAGKRLARVLEAMGVDAGAVVVARWYGGVMLGPARFAHIENVAREAVREWRRAVVAEGVERRVVEEGRKKEGLVRVLGERDGSIEVLRGLLAEKKRVAGRGEGEGEKAQRKQMDYGKMPVQVLEKLEKARDATIAFILKELDTVEDEILKGMGEGDALDEGDEVAGETADLAGQDGKNDETMAGDVPGGSPGAAQEEELTEQKQCDSAVETESPAKQSNPDAG
ncbi:Impact family protein [Lasiodiplodia theobromae]|uniref:Impact family protein n=1 Tax=Lasiodiplodia theobromae TaxID=45133 RepID=UPI0015C30072|nr:Impact family protein [Lasiodiplodia theobromae]KAF4534401.1 Impact family protein [Lasiodiplodia theobromae]